MAQPLSRQLKAKLLHPSSTQQFLSPPSTCKATYDRIEQCLVPLSSSSSSSSSTPTTTTTTTNTIVCFLSHCGSLFGTCNGLCGGLGDRMLSILSHAASGLEDCTRLKLDNDLAGSLHLRYPTMGYQPSLKERLWFRSYDGKERLRLPEDEVGEDHFYLMNDGPGMDAVTRPLVTKWNARCLFHGLFLIDDGVLASVSATLASIPDIDVGLHLRVGDAALAPLLTVGDLRVTSLENAVGRITERALQLTSGGGTSGGGTSGTGRVWMATDSVKAREIVEGDPRVVLSKVGNPGHLRFSTSSSNRNDNNNNEIAHANAWHDVLTLSTFRTIVVNGKEKNYTGTSRQISTFAELAGAIGGGGIEIWNPN